MKHQHVRSLLTALVFGLAFPLWLCDARGHPAETWEPVTPATLNDVLSDLVTDGAIFYALTDDPAGTVLRSDDGVHFVREPLGVPGTGPNHALRWHAGQWHAVRGGALFRKTPAALWEPVPLAPPRIVGLASIEGELWVWTFGGFDHTGGDPLRVLPHLWRKADAMPWIEVTVTAAVTSAVDYSGLIRQNGRYVLSGNGFDFDRDNFTGGVWTSSDGANWVVSAFGDYRGVAWNGARFVGGSNSGRITFSDDGIAWFRVSFPFVDNYISTDQGLVPVPSPAASIRYFNNAFWVVTSTFGTPILAKSADGIQWDEVTAGQTETERAPLRELRVIGGVPYFLGAQGYLWRAVDWEIARERLLPQEPWHWQGAAANADALIVVGESGRVARSVDGVSFAYSSLGGAQSADGIAWLESAQIFIAAGRDAVGSVKTWSSPDGQMWQENAHANWPAGALGIAAGSDGAMICGPDGRLAFSSDGATWLPVASGTTADLSQVAFGGGRWVAAGPSGVVIHSTDRVIWQSTARPANPHFVWNAGIWYFAHPRDLDSGGSFTGDFSEWSNVPSFTLPAYSGLVAAFGEIFGNEGSFLTSSADVLTWDFRSEVNLTTTPHRCLTAGVRFRDRLVYAGQDGRIHRSSAWRDFYHEWRQSRFPAGQRDVEAISGPAADPDRDGASNAVEYACGLNPLLPAARTKISFDAESRAFHYPRATSAGGVALWTEFSADLQQWRRTGMFVASSPDDFDPGLAQVWASPSDPEAPRGFFRLRATLAPPP